MECRQQPRCDEVLELREEVKRLRAMELEVVDVIANENKKLRAQNAKLKACMKRVYYCMSQSTVTDCPPNTACSPDNLGCTYCQKKYIAHGGE